MYDMSDERGNHVTHCNYETSFKGEYMKTLYMLRRPTAYSSSPKNDFWTSIRTRFSSSEVKMELVGIFLTEADAGICSQPGDEILRVPCFNNAPDYKQWRQDKLRQQALDKLSPEEKQALMESLIIGEVHAQTNEQRHHKDLEAGISSTQEAKKIQ